MKVELKPVELKPVELKSVRWFTRFVLCQWSLLLDQFWSCPVFPSISQLLPYEPINTIQLLL